MMIEMSFFMCASWSPGGQPRASPFRSSSKNIPCLLSAAPSAARTTRTSGAGCRRAATAARARHRGTHAARAYALHGFEIDDRLSVIQDGTEFGDPCVGEIAL